MNTRTRKLPRAKATYTRKYSHAALSVKDWDGKQTALQIKLLTDGAIAMDITHNGRIYHRELSPEEEYNIVTLREPLEVGA